MIFLMILFANEKIDGEFVFQAKVGNLQFFQKAFQDGSLKEQILRCDDGVLSLVHYVMVHNQPELFNYFLQNGLYENNCDPFNFKPLITHRNHEMIRMAFSFGLRPTIEDVKYACGTNFYWFVEEAVSLGFDPFEIDSDGENLLFASCTVQSFSITKYLLKLGLDINHRNDDGSTPAFYAVIGGDLDFIRFVAESGFNFNSKNNDGETPLEMLNRYGKVEEKKFLLREFGFFMVRD